MMKGVDQSELIQWSQQSIHCKCLSVPRPGNKSVQSVAESRHNKIHIQHPPQMAKYWGQSPTVNFPHLGCEGQTGLEYKIVFHKSKSGLPLKRLLP